MSRVPYISRDDLPPDGKVAYDRFEQTRGYVSDAFKALFNHPRTAEAVASFGEYVRYNSTLDPTIRETAILAAARELNSQYEWTHHEPVARKAGVRDEVIQAIRDRRAPWGLPPKEGVWVRYAQELIRNHKVTEATHEAIVHLIGAQGAIDLAVTIGYFLMLSHLLAALEVELEEDLTPLLPE